jgi:hypothetical protein
MAGEAFYQLLRNNRRRRKKARRKAAQKRDRWSDIRKKEKERYRALRGKYTQFIEDNLEPIPAETEIIDERTGSNQTDPRKRNRTRFGVLQTMPRGGYLGAPKSPMGGPK